jgi:hypothetical protein
MLALAIDAEPVAGGGRTNAEPGPLVADEVYIRAVLVPPSPGACSLNRGVVGEDRRTVQDMAADRSDRRLEQGGRPTNPAGQGRAVEIDALREDLALPVER